MRSSFRNSEINILGGDAYFVLESEKASLHASEKYYIEKEQAARGDTVGNHSNYEGSIEAYIKKSDAAYGDFANEGQHEREGTPQQYFQDDLASQGAATDYERYLQAS